MTLKTYQSMAEKVKRMTGTKSAHGDDFPIRTVNAIMDLVASSEIRLAWLHATRLEVFGEMSASRTGQDRRLTASSKLISQDVATQHTRVRHLHRLVSSPENILKRCKYLEASDPRDFVYGLIGLTDCAVDTEESLSAKTLLRLRIDYGLSVSQVFQQMTRYILNRDRGLRGLERNLAVESKSKSFELPSWTIDWTLGCAKSLRSPIDFLPFLSIQRVRNPSTYGVNFVNKNKRRLPSMQLQSGAFDGTIVLKGTLLGSVDFLSRKPDSPNQEGVLRCEMRSRLIIFDHEVPGLARYNASESLVHYCSDEGWKFDKANLNFHLPESIAAGDFFAQIDGLDGSSACLRPQLNGNFTLVCIVPAPDVVHTLVEGFGGPSCRKRRTIALRERYRRAITIQ